MSNLINDYYIEEVFETIDLNNKEELRILTSLDVRKSTELVDIRKYKLYGNGFDDIKKPTRKGIKFKLSNIKQIMLGLNKIMLNHGIISILDYETINIILAR